MAKSKTRITEPVCIPNPECAAEFAVITEQLKNMKEQMEKSEKSYIREIKDLRAYLKEEYNIVIKDQITTLQLDLKATKIIVGKMNKKMLMATGSVAGVTFLIGLAAPYLAKLIGG